MATQYTGHLYADAVHYAMTNAMAPAAPAARMERMRELLYGLAQTIPCAWNTLARKTLENREGSIDRIVYELSLDMGQGCDPIRYHVLNSVLLVALTIKQMTMSTGRVLSV